MAAKAVERPLYFNLTPKGIQRRMMLDCAAMVVGLIDDFIPGEDDDDGQGRSLDGEEINEMFTHVIVGVHPADKLLLLLIINLSPVVSLLL